MLKKSRYFSVLCLTLGLPALAFASACDKTPFAFENATGHPVELIEASTYDSTTKIIADPIGTVYESGETVQYIASSGRGSQGSANGKILFRDLETKRFHMVNYNLRKFLFSCYLNQGTNYAPVTDSLSYKGHGSYHLSFKVTLNDY